MGPGLFPAALSTRRPGPRSSPTRVHLPRRQTFPRSRRQHGRPAVGGACERRDAGRGQAEWAGPASAETRGGAKRGRGLGRGRAGRWLPGEERGSKMATTKRVLYVGEQARAPGRVWARDQTRRAASSCLGGVCGGAALLQVLARAVKVFLVPFQAR